MPNVMTSAQVRRIYTITGLYPDGFIDDDLIEDLAYYIGAINADGTAYDSTYDNNLGIEVLDRAISRIQRAGEPGAEDLRRTQGRLAATAQRITTTILPPGGATEADIDAAIAAYNIDPNAQPLIRARVGELERTQAQLAESGDNALIVLRMNDDGEVLFYPAGLGGVSGPIRDLMGDPVAFARRHHVPDVKSWALQGGGFPTPADFADNPELGAVLNVHSVGGELVFGYGFTSGLIFTTGDPGDEVGREGTRAIAFYTGNNPPQAWQKLASGWESQFTWPAGGGTPGQGGLTQAEVDGRIRALVTGAVRIPQVGTIAPAVALSSGLNAGRWVRVASNGQTLYGYDAPTWLDDAAVRIPGGKIGASWANNTFLATIGNITTWLTHAQAVAQLKGALFSLLANNSDQIRDPGDGSLVIEGTGVPTAAQLLPRFKDDQVEVEDGKLNIIIDTGGGLGYNGSERVLNQQNLSTNRAGGSIVTSFELPAVRRGERVRFLAVINIITPGAANADLGPHRLSLSDTAPLSEHANGWVENRDFIRGGTILDPDEVGTYGIDGPVMISYVSGAVTVYLHRTQDGNADPDVRYGLQIYAERSGGQGVAGVTDYNDLTNRPIVEMDPANAADDFDGMIIWGDGAARDFYKPHRHQATPPAWVIRDYGTADDLDGGDTWGGYVDTFGDLPVAPVANTNYGIVQELRTYAFRTQPPPDSWRVTDEDFYDARNFPTEAAALAALGRHFHDDDAANGVHIWVNSEIKTVIDYTAGTSRYTLWLPYDYELQEAVDNLTQRVTHIEGRYAGVRIHTTQDDYDNAPDDDGLIHFLFLAP